MWECFPISYVGQNEIYEHLWEWECETWVHGCLAKPIQIADTNKYNIEYV